MDSQSLRACLARLSEASPAVTDSQLGLQQIISRLSLTLRRDRLVQTTLEGLRQSLQVDRVVLYYFFRQWRGQVTAESVIDPAYSILGSSGADDCFTQEYAQMYLEGRVQAIADVTRAAIAPCHLEFLQGLRVQANLVAPVRVPRGLWGLLVAHHCQGPYPWSAEHVAQICQATRELAQAASIRES